MELGEGGEGGRDGAGEVVAGEVEVEEEGEEREGVGESAGEEVLREVEVDERGAEGNIKREGLVDGVVVEDDGGEVRDAAEEGGGEWACHVEVGQVQGGYGGVCWAGTCDAGPVAWSGVAVVPC